MPQEGSGQLPTACTDQTCHVEAGIPWNWGSKPTLWRAPDAELPRAPEDKPSSPTPLSAEEAVRDGRKHVLFCLTLFLMKPEKVGAANNSKLRSSLAWLV